MTPNVQLAPMEGVLDGVLRGLLSQVGGVDRMVTEFVRVTDKRVPDHVFHSYCPELQTGGRTLAGTPVFVQLLGGQPSPLADNAARVAELGAPGVDLNFGCPAKTVNRHDGGAVLLKEPERIFNIIQTVRRSLPESTPLTAKVRLGFDHKDFHGEIAQAASEGGASHLVVHARTKTEMYTPPAHWHYIPAMQAKSAIPILANGEIWSVTDYRACQAASGVSRVALGRGLVRNPTLGLEIQRELGRIDEVTFERKIKSFDRAIFLKDFFTQTLTWKGPRFAIARLKQILRYWAPVDAFWGAWFERVKTLQTLDEIENFFYELGHGQNHHVHLDRLPLLRARQGVAQAQGIDV